MAIIFDSSLRSAMEDDARCAQCGDRGPWVGIPNDAPKKCWCEMTWFRRACGWQKSKKGGWYCSRCWEVDGASQAQGMENICVYCRKVVTEAMRIQIKRRQEDAASFYKIHQQQFQRQSVIDSMSRSSPRGPALPPPKVSAPAAPKASLETQQVTKINGKWQLVYKTPPPQPAAAVATAPAAKRSRSLSSSRSSSSRRARKKHKKKKKKKKKRSSSSSSSRHSAQSAAAKSGANAADAELNRLLSLQKTTESKPKQRQIDDEVEKTKRELLNKLVELKKMESKEERVREFRALLRAWHPDKNPSKVEVATLVFQFLQKSKQLLD